MTTTAVTKAKKIKISEYPETLLRKLFYVGLFDTDPETLTTEDVADALLTNKTAVLSWIKKGFIRAKLMKDGSYRIRKSHLWSLRDRASLAKGH